jgi:hypothetical protein
MNQRLLRVATVAFILSLGMATVAADEPAASKKDAEDLSSHDAALFDKLLRDFVFDPQGAEFVSAPAKLRTAWAQEAFVERSGWRVAGKKGEPDRIYFADGENLVLAADAKIKKLDFIGSCRSLYEPKREPAPKDPNDSEVFKRMRRHAVGDFDTPDLVNAVWLYRLGEKKLAARALKRAAYESAERRSRSGGETKLSPAEAESQMIADVKEQLATAAFLAMVHAYMVRSDEEALAHGQRLVRLYPDDAKKRPQVADVIADLDRRKKKGTFGKEPAISLPQGYDSWDVNKKVAYWIDALDEVDARQWGQPGGVALGMDRRVEALIKLGDVAVPALIDTIEKDERLTRSVHFWRDFSPARTVLAVREAALSAAMSIMRVQAFDPVATGDNFTSRGETAGKAMADKLREYWKTYGKLPFDERMMKVLTDPKVKPESWREAAANLARPNDTQVLSTTVFSSFVGNHLQSPNPVIKKFEDPTVAEAILAAMDRDLAAHEANKRDQLYDYDRRHIEDAYFSPLIEIADKRIAPVLVRRYKSAERLRMRRKLAFAAEQCGDSAPMKEFARAFEQRKFTLPANNDPNTNSDDQPGNVELDGIVATLIDSHLPEADQALQALVDAKHPQHALVAARLVDPHSRRGIGDRNPLFGHPFCLAFLRRSLDDTHPTGTVWTIAGDTLETKGENFSSSESIPADLADPAVRVDRAEERECDRVAVIVNDLVLGIPVAHPLRKESDAALKEMKRLLDLYRGRFRLAASEEARALDVSPWRQAFFIPTIGRLGRPATVDDVAQGKAIFELKGKGKVADLKLPAVASLKRTQLAKHPDESHGSLKVIIESAFKPRQEPEKVIVVQAEKDAEGATHYGVIGRYFIRAMAANELDDIKPIPRPAE